MHFWYKIEITPEKCIFDTKYKSIENKYLVFSILPTLVLRVLFYEYLKEFKQKVNESFLKMKRSYVSEMSKHK